MDLGEKMTMLEDEIYDSIVGLLQKNEIPSTVGRMIMDGVYRRFMESAYFVALKRMDCLEQELLELRNKETSSKKQSDKNKKERGTAI